MADEIDRANDAAEIVRAAHLSMHFAQAWQVRAPAQHAEDGRRICIDCRAPIAQQRLAAVPHAVACLDCEHREERRRQQYRPRGQ